MNTNHTPGPWEYRGGFISTCGDEPTIVSGIPRWHKKHTRINDEPFGGFQNGYYWPSKEEIEANARLIAVSPDMRNTLNDLRDAWMNGRMDIVGGILSGDVLADLLNKVNP